MDLFIVMFPKERNFTRKLRFDEHIDFTLQWIHLRQPDRINLSNSSRPVEGLRNYVSNPDWTGPVYI